MRGLVSIDQLPGANAAGQRMVELSRAYGEVREDLNLPRLREDFSLPVTDRALKVSALYMHNGAGDEYGLGNGRLAVGAPRLTALSKESCAPNLADGELNFNLVATLRREVKGGIFDREITSYPIASFLPHNYFYLNIAYKPASTGQKELCFAASNRFAFPVIDLYPGNNILSFPNGLIEGLNDHPFYAPTLKDWDDPEPTAQTYARSMSLVFVPVDRNLRHKSRLGEIVMLKIIYLAGSFDDMPFGQYLKEILQKMGVDLPGFLVSQNSSLIPA